MRVLHIIDHVGMGGAQTILKGIFEKNKANRNIFYYALRNNKIKVEIDHPNIRSYEGYSKYNIKSLLELRMLIKNEKIESLHCHLAKSMFFGYLIKLLFFKNIKLIFHEHGRIFENQNLYNHFLKKTQNSIDLYIAVSKTTRNKLIKDACINPNKIEVLYNFVDLEKFNPNQFKKFDQIKIRKNNGLNEMNFVIGFAGRLNKIKGCDVLIKSVPYINIEKFRLLIAGDGYEKSNLEKLAKDLNIQEKVVFLGYLNNMINFYGLIDCLVIPSRSESFGLSAIEAQALGVPVIAARTTGLNEIVLDETTGLLFQKNNEKELADKINLMYNNLALRKKLIRESKDYIIKYSLYNYINELDKIYEIMKKHVKHD